MTADKPRTAKARSVVDMIRRGETLYAAAKANYVTVQAAKIMYFRWILKPRVIEQDAEIERLQAEVESLSAELLEMKRNHQGMRGASCS